ncbi:MAG: ribosome biogenesis GTPase Der [Pseudomonadota bacterium]
MSDERVGLARPRIAILGRPNVGKSTLFNRLARKRLALVDDQPGVTRDRRDTETEIAGTPVTLVDTAGFEDATDGSLQARMRAQTEAAITSADHVLFVFDARAGVTPVDETFAENVRKSGVPVTLVANKSEGRAGDAGFYDAFRLGLGEPVAVSAEHGEGISDLETAILDALQARAVTDEPTAEDEENSNALHLAIVGRPNAGKSTLVNTLLDEDRLLTGPEAGITRDTISIDWTWKGKTLRLFDTAGLRRKSRVQERLEKLSVGDTIRAIRFAHIVILVVDIDQPLEKQDLQIADLVIREGRGLVIAVNKIDQIDDLSDRRLVLQEMIDRLLPQIRGVPVHFISAETGRGTAKLIDKAVALYDTWNVRVPTAKLNTWLTNALQAHPPPAPRGRKIKIRYMTQPKTRPPTFVAFCSRPDAVPDAYKRYLVNGLREDFDLKGTPIRLFLRRRENPYDPASST